MLTPRPAGRLCAALRIRKRPEFQEIQARGRRVTTVHFALLLYARAVAQPGTPPRLGVTVSRKVGNAVVRNRAKRLVREAFRATRDLWAPDVDLVVIVRKAPRDLALAAVVGEWRDAETAVRRRTLAAMKDRERRESKLAQRP